MATNYSGKLISTYDAIVPGEVWRDTAGDPIQAHGGGMLYVDGTFYWYGENKSGPTQVVPSVNAKGKKIQRYRMDVIGVSCYASKDLLHWTNEGIALPSRPDDPAHDLHPSNVLERPKVIYNARTRQYVMWMHIDTADYQYARAGVAVSDSPAGPFRYLGSVNPNGHQSRDLSLFQDDDGTAYLFYSSENNKTLHAVQLSDDYLQPTDTYKRNFIDQYREAPAIFKHQSTYYMITSGCTGWEPNPALYAVAKHPLGPWQLIDNPCEGERAETTFDSQSTFVFKLPGEEGRYIFMADRWNKADLGDSRYVWLPLQVDLSASSKVTISWQQRWSPADLY